MPQPGARRSGTSDGCPAGAIVGLAIVGARGRDPWPAAASPASSRRRPRAAGLRDRLGRRARDRRGRAPRRARRGRRDVRGARLRRRRRLSRSPRGAVRRDRGARAACSPSTRPARRRAAASSRRATGSSPRWPRRCWWSRRGCASGALITARLARELGRPLLAVPGQPGHRRADRGGRGARRSPTRTSSRRALAGERAAGARRSGRVRAAAGRASRAATPARPSWRAAWGCRCRQTLALIAEAELDGWLCRRPGGALASMENTRGN